MINFIYVLHPASCGYYCLRKIVKRGNYKRVGYMSLYEIKEILMSYNYYCFCCKLKDLESVKKKCITMLKTKNSLHYVIIKEVRDKYIYFYDPLFLFVIKKKKDWFLRKWNGICLFYSFI